MTRRKPARAVDQLDEAENKSHTDDIEVVIEEENQGNTEAEIEAQETEDGDLGTETADDPLSVLRLLVVNHWVQLWLEACCSRWC